MVLTFEEEKCTLSFGEMINRIFDFMMIWSFLN